MKGNLDSYLLATQSKKPRPPIDDLEMVIFNCIPLAISMPGALKATLYLKDFPMAAESIL